MAVPKPVMAGSGPFVTKTVLAVWAKVMMLNIWPLLLARLMAPRSVQELLSQVDPLSSRPVVTVMPAPPGEACARVTSQGHAPTSSAASTNHATQREIFTFMGFPPLDDLPNDQR